MLFVIYLEMNSRFEGRAEGYVFSILANLIVYKLLMGVMVKFFENQHNLEVKENKENKGN
jgi:hypothetical protein